MGYRVYGPYLSQSEKRRVVVLYKDKKDRTSMSYARFLMFKKMGRWLSKDEQVDHINGNPLDDRIENLQILTSVENIRKSHPGRKVNEHGNLSMLRYCKPPCDLCKKAKQDYNRDYHRRNRKQDM